MPNNKKEFGFPGGGGNFKNCWPSQEIGYPLQLAWFQTYPHFPASAFTEKKIQLNIEHLE